MKRRKRIALVFLTLIIVGCVCLIGTCAAKADENTEIISANSLVFITTKEDKLVMIYLEKGGYYAKLDPERIRSVIDAADAETLTLPAYDYFIEKEDKTDLDALVKEIDAGTTVLQTAKKGADFLWDLSGKISEATQSFWEKTGLPDKIRSWFSKK